MPRRRRDGRRDIVLFHPGKQHAYAVADALERDGRLRCFYTSLFIHPGSVARRAAMRLPALMAQQVLNQLDKRTHPGIPPDRVRSWPYAEALSRSAGRWPVLPQRLRHHLQYPFVNAAFDRHVARRLRALVQRPSVVYGFLGAAEHTFTAARELGIATVLDVPIVLDAREVIREENSRCGVRDAPEGLPRARMHREIMTADLVVVPSEAVAQSVEMVEPTARRVSVVRFGVDTRQFTPDSARRPVPGRLAVLFAGRLAPRKGVHVLLDAWRHVPAEWTLALAGPPGPQQYVDQLRTRYRPNVSEAGNLSPAALATFFQSGDVFVFPSLAEGSALVTYQALAAGLPCIVTAESGSVVRDGIEGFVVPAREPAAIAARLDLLAHDDGLRARMAVAARLRAEWFTWERYADSLLQALDDLGPPL